MLFILKEKIGIGIGMLFMLVGIIGIGMLFTLKNRYHYRKGLNFDNRLKLVSVRIG